MPKPRTAATGDQTQNRRIGRPKSDTPLRHAILPIALALALVTGIVLAETRTVILAPAVAVNPAPRQDASAATVRRFFAAANDLLRDGKTGPVEETVAPEFVERTPHPAATPDRAGLIAVLRSLRTVAPAARFAVDDLLAQDERVVARVHLDGIDEASFLDLPISPGLLWGSVDLFRIRSGQIVEHWGDRETSALFAPLLALSVPVGSPARKIVALERWRFEAGGTLTNAVATGPLVLLVTAGTLTVTLDPGSPQAAQIARVAIGKSPVAAVPLAAGEEWTLAEGAAVVLPQGAHYGFASNTPAEALALSMVALPSGHGTALASADGEQVTRPTPPSSTGLDRTVLAGGMGIDLPGGTLNVALGRVTLAPLTALPPHPAGVAELVGSEGGAVSVAVDGGTAWVMSGPGRGIRTTASATLPTGGGALLPAGLPTTYRAGSDAAAVLLLLRLTAGNTDGMSASPAAKG
jgi:predicted ester cyclase